jgi:uncharacterized protein (TIGR00725 family)
MRKKVVSIIGEGTIGSDDDRYLITERIGFLLIDNGYRVMTGGLGGAMEAASKGARNNPKHKDGDIIGILPGQDPADANEYVDIAIPTGLGIARNHVVTNSDAVIAVGGGAGTLSEIAFAWQKGRLIIAMKVEGWSGEMAGKRIDGRRSMAGPGMDSINEANTPEEAIRLLKELLPP